MSALDPSTLMRDALLAMSRRTEVRDAMVNLPVTSRVVSRYVPGETFDDAARDCAGLLSQGRLATVDHLGEDITDLAQATGTKEAYLRYIRDMGEAGLTEGGQVEFSLKLSALGQFLGADGEKVALENAREIARAAANAGTTITLDMEDHTTTDSTLGILRELREDFPDTGAVLQAYLRRTQGDCRDLATAGSRVRLCKGAYKEPESVAFTDDHEVDLNYVECAKILMHGDGYPMMATHDPNMIDIAGFLADQVGRSTDSWEFQMLYGIRPQEEERLISEGYRVRVYLPNGPDWYGYFMRRLAERPANVAFFARSLLSRG
ncbi:L-proline dehydrogenase [Kytococcus aerolatus]|uniref:proline dehydrogenase n=1 Tax=Kytococcus aerolatus TaxID=592308 RepID=A0A212TD00_9MICO|nr:proline dehydrogenase family protein [Kytococcus aerolatus]SNC63957.1 L-proline dehydrogenase [Kytococcus aerolatus]